MMKNFITGRFEELPKTEPSSAWLMGWYAFMESVDYSWDPINNPYPPRTQDYYDYEDGWEAARKD